ncbi:MAG TPA: DUF1194 domain-containing protein [Alphaproteobacteria bacterium]|jgi:hypothetical protein
MWRNLLIAAALLAVPFPPPDARAQTPVDLELVLAVDVSGSMDEVEAELQRQGYLRALVNPRVIRAIQSGPHRRIAVVYLEWAGMAWQKVVVDWTLVHDAVSAQAFASAIAEEPVITERRTSISSAIDFAVRLFERSPYKGTRRAIDISGDGPNNRGRSILAARAEAVARGITINGLPIVNDRPNPWGGPPPRNLDLYYQEFVIGGPGAFMMPATDMRNFGQAILAKLIREIAHGPAAAGTDIAARAPARTDSELGER